MPRRSRCAYVATLTVLVYVIIVCILGFGVPQTRPFTGKWLEISLNFSKAVHIFQVKDLYSFDKWAEAIFRNVVADSRDDKDIRMATYNIDWPDQPRDVVEFPSFLVGKDENPHLFPHDPQVTLAILLSDFNSRLNMGSSPANLSIDWFHWADWTDLSLLDQIMFSAEGAHINCAILHPQQHEMDDFLKVPTYNSNLFCFDDLEAWSTSNLTGIDASMSQYIQGIQKKPYKCGFHVFRSPKRAPLRVRKLAAVSYLNDFMPPPVAVNFLFATSSGLLSSINVPVNQNISGRVRLMDTPVAEIVAQNNLTVSLRQEISALSGIVMLKRATFLQTEKELHHSDFVDNLSKIASVLAQQEDLPLHDQRYLISLRQSLNTKSPTKYFFEALLSKSERNWAAGGHYDWRFFKGVRTSTEKHLPRLHGLILAWLRFTNANDITTWIAHGSLLGWYWNGLSFPWDSDYDVQMPIADLHKLSRKFNQTIIVDLGILESPETRLGRYFLDCGTWISHREAGNGLNNIDARFIDMESGLYIDITGLALSSNVSPIRYYDQLPFELQRQYEGRVRSSIPKFELQQNLERKLYNCRNKHVLSLQELSPLRLTMMEGVPAYVPNNFTEVLQAEYGQSGVDSQIFHTFAFLPRLRLWARSNVIKKYAGKDEKLEKKVSLGSDEQAALQVVDKLSMFSFKDQDYLEILSTEHRLLFEYLATKEVTIFHQKEMELLLRGESTAHLFQRGNDVNLQASHPRPDISNYIAVEQGESFGDKMNKYMNMYQMFKLRKKQERE